MIPTAAAMDALQILLTISELGIADAMDLRIGINAEDLAAKINVTSPELLFRLMRSAATALRPGNPAVLMQACPRRLHIVLQAQLGGQSCSCTLSLLQIAPLSCAQQ